jgi:hypothetical protein
MWRSPTRLRHSCTSSSSTCPRSALHRWRADTHTTLINGTVRAGRSLAVRQNLMKAISQSWSSLTGQPEEQLLINITAMDASTVMEAGVILPQPGEEAAWFEHNRARLSALAPDGIKGL